MSQTLPGAAPPDASIPSGWAGDGRARARLGTTLNGKWHLDALLGVGGMAAVYAATHRNGKRVAIKMLHAELRDRPELLARFRREGYVANKVGHPAAVSVLDDDVAEDGAVYMVMDLLEGSSLEQLRTSRGGSLETNEALAIIDTVLDVLVAAHSQGIIHRDLKPDNIFILRDGQVRVLDFGIAALREQAHEAKVTLSGSIMGTPGFMPPEQARGLWDLVDAQTDLWAVGATLFTLLSGQCLHKGRSVNEELLLAMTQPVPEVRTLVPSLPDPLAKWLDRALAFEKSARWPDARTMQQEGREARRLAMYTAAAPARTQTPLVHPNAPTRARATATMRGLPAVLAAVAVLVALAAVAGLVVWRVRSSNAENTATAHKEPAEPRGLADAAVSIEEAHIAPAAIEAKVDVAPSEKEVIPAAKAKASAAASHPGSKGVASAAPSASGAVARPFDPLGRRK